MKYTEQGTLKNSTCNLFTFCASFKDITCPLFSCIIICIWFFSSFTSRSFWLNTTSAAARAHWGEGKKAQERFNMESTRERAHIIPQKLWFNDTLKMSLKIVLSFVSGFFIRKAETAERTYYCYNVRINHHKDRKIFLTFISCILTLKPVIQVLEYIQWDFYKFSRIAMRF